MMRNVVGALFVLSAVTAGFASPWWVAYEADDGRLPEEVGPWKRNWGNWQGQFKGPGAYRTIKDGILTYDSLYDPGVYDFAYMERPGQMDPGPGQLFVMEFGLRVERVLGRADPDIGLRSDDAWAVGFEFAEDRIYSVFEPYVVIPITPGVFHEYRFQSADMRVYDLYIDGQLARRGAFLKRFVRSEVGFGDAIQGAASLHHWDYVRVGVIPEPGALAMILTALLVGYRRGT